MSAKNTYETTIIVNAGLEDTAIDGIVEKTAQFIKEGGGEISNLDKWGRKRLAYPIKKKNNGYYTYYLFEGPADLPPKMERFFFLEEHVIRHLTLQLSPKALEFRIKQRELKGAETQDAGSAANANETSDDASKEKPAAEKQDNGVEEEIAIKVGGDTE